MRLGAGHFLGTRLGLHSFDGLTVTSYTYPAAATLPNHDHERAYLSLPLQGSYQEHYGRSTAGCKPGEGVFHPAGEAHRDRFDARGATILSIELEARWVEQIRDLGLYPGERRVVRGAAVERARRLSRLLLSTVRRSSGRSASIDRTHARTSIGS
jgi:quercetin dioxygenase-like cupin family protein